MTEQDKSNKEGKCPYCGGEPSIKNDWLKEGSSFALWWYISCNECGVIVKGDSVADLVEALKEWGE